MKETLMLALRAAGEYQLEQFHLPQSIREKESISSVVTAVDLECERRILEIIKSRYPAHNILSEESGYRHRQSSITWVIDPLDGTSNYAAGLPWFGVLIALMVDDKPQLAGAYLPVQDKLYLAEAGNGVTVNGNALIIESRELKDSLVAFSMDYPQYESDLSQALHFYTFLVSHARNIRSTNSLLDFMNVAEGNFGGCINLYTCIWDIASPYLIITEAGGIFRMLDNKDIVFSAEEESIKRNYPVITGNRRFFEQVMLGMKEHLSVNQTVK